MLAQNPVRNAILSSLPPEDLACLFPHFEFVRFKERTVLQEQRRRVEQFGFVETGAISLRRTSKGKVVELALLGSQGIVGATRLLGSDESSHQCMSVTSGTLFNIGAETLLDLMDKREGIREHLFRHVQTLLVHCSQVALCGLHHGAAQRLAGWLCQASDAARGMEIPVTHDYLSTMLGLRRATVTEVLTQLQRDGFILKHRGAIRVRNRALLASKGCGCLSLGNSQSP
jgi:CRP-like cAMP-binding protein